jgi:hypothetical protein
MIGSLFTSWVSSYIILHDETNEIQLHVPW